MSGRQAGGEPLAALEAERAQNAFDAVFDAKSCSGARQSVIVCY